MNAHTFPIANTLTHFMYTATALPIRYTNFILRFTQYPSHTVAPAQLTQHFPSFVCSGTNSSDFVARNRKYPSKSENFCAVLRDTFFFCFGFVCSHFCQYRKIVWTKGKKKKLYGKKFFRLPNQKWKRTRNSFVWGTVGALGARYYGSWMLTLKGTYIVGSVQGIL